MALENGTHWRGPLLGGGTSEGGLLAGVPLGAVDRVRSRYKVFAEYFDYPAALVATALTGTGATITDINTATAPLLSITSNDLALVIDAGTKADSGTEIQWVSAVSQATYLTPATRVLGPITSTATLMDNREMFFLARVGFRSNSTAWDGKALIGWFTQDTSLLSNTTGIPTVATGGGIGWHVSELGLLRPFCTQTAITAFSQSQGVAASIVALPAANEFSWYDLGFRCRWIDASAGTGTCDFYINGSMARQTVSGGANTSVGQPLSVTSNLPMASTEVYAITAAVQNGPAQLADIAIEYIISGITRPGMTNTSA